MNPVAVRLLNQQLYAPQFSQMEDVVRHFGALQAQDCRMVQWAVASRTQGLPTQSRFNDLFNQGTLVRTHLMRGTWQVVHADDYHWLLQLFAPKADAIIKGWMHGNKIDISDDERHRMQELFAEILTEMGSATKEQLAEALAFRGVVMDDHRLSYNIRFAEIDGVVCNGNWHPLKPTYSLAAQKLPQASAIARDEALLRLAQRYFQSRQPASLQDFVWWSGLSMGDCRKAVDLMGDHLHKITIEGEAYYVTDSCRIRGFRQGKLLLIAPYDEYLISYKSRYLVLDPWFAHKAHNNTGVFFPIMAYNGMVCGNWTPHKSCPNPTFFNPQADYIEAVDAAWQKYQAFLCH